MMPAKAAEPGQRLSALLTGMAEVARGDDVLVTGLSHRAQTVMPGDLFLAVAGMRSHGLHYLHEALSRGAAAVAWEPVPDIAPSVASETPSIAVQQLGWRLGAIADRFYDHPSGDLTVIGVTGTDGKTSVSHFVAQALDAPHAPCGLIGTLGYGLYGRLERGQHTTPDAIRLHAELANMRARGARVAVLEVSSHALAQHRVDDVAVDVAILTNLTRDHLDYHASAAAYAAAKRRLFELPELRHAIVNTDEAFGRELARSLSAAITLGYGLGNSPLPAERMVCASGIESTQTGLRFRVRTPWGDGEVNSALLGRFNVSNLLAALTTLLAVGMPLGQALSRLQQARGAPGRMERHGGGERPLVVVDYAHTPAALAQVLTALREHCAGHLWCVFGCGGDRDPGKRPLMAQAAERHADAVIVTDDNPRTEAPAAITADILGGFSDPTAVRIIHDRADAIACAVSAARAGDIVVVAGKGHEREQIVGAERRPFSDGCTVAELLGQRSS